jgi:hypothetical protein
MRWRRSGLMAFAFLATNALAVDLSWLYRFAIREPNPPIRSCFGWPSPWERLCDSLGRGRIDELPHLLMFHYESRELVSLLVPAPILALALFYSLRGLGAFRVRFRLRAVLVAVAFSAFEFEAIRYLWGAVDAWEYSQQQYDPRWSYDTWIWGDDL